MSDPLDRVVQTIAGLGIASAEAVTPHLNAYRQRPPFDATCDDDGEVGSFLTLLYQAGVLDQAQFSVLIRLLEGDGVEPELPQDGAMVGQRFGQYVAQAKIGQGAMAEVYRAKQLQGGPEDYVVKVCTDTDRDGIERFQREAEIMASFEHPNIVRVFANGVHARHHYMVMEYVDGPSLQEVLERRQRFPWESATRAIRQVAAALAEIHAQEIVHRDVKPHNILVARDGTLKLCDFGVARMVKADLTSRAGEILGSPSYIAPEQWGDHKVDHRADLFAVGVIYYQLITGATPFKGRTAAQLAARIQAGQYLPLGQVLPDLPPPVAHVVDQLLESDRRYRTPSAKALMRDTARLIQREHPDVPRLEPGDVGLSSPFALVGQASVVVGGGQQVDLWIRGGESTTQASLDRTSSGRLLRILDPDAGTKVNGEVIDGEVVLKEGDELVFNESCRFTYREGNLGQARDINLAQSGEILPPHAERAPPVPRVVHGILAAALEDAGHPSQLMRGFEILDGLTAQATLDDSRLGLQTIGLPADVVEGARRRGGFLWQLRASRLSERLFLSTHENLGVDVRNWLGWWFEVRDRYPVQVHPRMRRVKARLLITEPGRKPSFVDLVGKDMWSVGRAVETDVVLSDTSASRWHLRLYRLITRFALRDLGSRQGVRKNGIREEIALTRLGDVLELGRVRLRLVALPGTERIERPTRYPVDRSTFAALLEQSSPATLETLIDLLEVDRLWKICDEGAPDLGLTEPLGTIVLPFLEVHRALALDALPRMAGVDLGEDAAAWREWAAEQQLPRQVAPFGWCDPR